MSAWGAVAQVAAQTQSAQRGDRKFANWLYGDGAAEAGKDAETYMNKAYPGTTPLERLGGGGGGSGSYVGAEISNKSALSGAQASVMSTKMQADATKEVADKKQTTDLVSAVLNHDATTGSYGVGPVRANAARSTDVKDIVKQLAPEAYNKIWGKHEKTPQRNVPKMNKKQSTGVKKPVKIKDVKKGLSEGADDMMSTAFGSFK